MKSIVLIGAMLGILLKLSSCCTKALCHDADSINQINFYNFSQADIDTVVILSYAKKTNFISPLDSMVVLCQSWDDSFVIFLSERIKIDLDYKIKVVSIGKVYTVNDLLQPGRVVTHAFLIDLNGISIIS